MDKKLSVSEQKRHAILNGAKQAFIDQGFAATSMDHVASIAGVSKRTVYNHFSSKEDLFSAIVLELVALFSQSMAFTFQADRPVRDQLIAIADAKIQVMLNEDLVQLARLVLSETIRSPDKMCALMDKAQEGDDLFSRFLEEARQQGALQIEDICFASNQFTSLIKGAVFWPVVVMGQPKPSKEAQAVIVERTVDMFLASYEK
ncbi:TetR/AcrR family transcriptional regulator [Litoribacillus peritrichatus]|uniref:TetR/AcrR family transcriptional regulator n=1 Tax=Litoribacillus peritrichatus TaxID=718191 RepID=A0ABP7N2T7_9GAMM